MRVKNFTPKYKDKIVSGNGLRIARKNSEKNRIKFKS